MTMSFSPDFKKAFLQGIESFMKSKPIHELVVTEVCMDCNPRPEASEKFWMHPDMQFAWRGISKLFDGECPCCGLKVILPSDMTDFTDAQWKLIGVGMYDYNDQLPESVNDKLSDLVTRLYGPKIAFTKT